MSTTDLSKRQIHLLKLIIEMYISQAKPIASKTTLKHMEKTEFACSSATIRNEMFILEKLGYIEKPHNSGGRVSN